MSKQIQLHLLKTIAALFIAVFCVEAQPSTPSNWTPEQQLKIKIPANPRISPDGKRIAYSVSTAIMSADKSENNVQIWVTTSDGKETLPVTSGEKSSTNPRWSPDGSSLAFTSTRNNNRNNIFLHQWPGGEAKALTNLKSNITQYEFSPDGKWIAFAMTDPKSDQEEKAERGKEDYKWIDENIKLTRLYLLNLDHAIEGKMEPALLTPQDFNVSSFDWSPDGKSIVFSHTKFPGLKYVHTSDVSLIDLHSRKTKLLVGSAIAEALPQFSTDGKYVSLVAGKQPIVSMINEYSLLIIPVSGGTSKTFNLDFDGRTTLFPGWAADGNFYFTEARGTITQFFAFNPATGKSKTIKSTGVSSNISLDPTGRLLSMVKQSYDKAPEIFISTISDFYPVKITNMNEELSSISIGKTEVIKWKSFDGKEIEGLLTYPLNYMVGQKVPLLLNIHGGPNGVFQQTYIGGISEEYPLASMSAAGFAILRPNPRGSCGYGTAFRRANIKDWGNGDYQDVMTGVDKVIKMGIADPGRLGVMGWSYGGYMTAWIITHSKRFKAASAGAAAINLISMTATSDFPQLTVQYLGGEHWNDPAIYQKLSPLSYVKHASTPTLIQHGENDVRVPVSQAYELYYALKTRNVPVKMLVLPRQGHVPAEPKMMLATMQSNLDWFQKYLGSNKTKE